MAAGIAVSREDLSAAAFHEASAKASSVRAARRMLAIALARWRWVDLQTRIRDLLGVETHEHTVGRQLAALGFVRLSARPQHPQADPKVQEVL